MKLNIKQIKEIAHGLGLSTSECSTNKNIITLRSFNCDLTMEIRKDCQTIAQLRIMGLFLKRLGKYRLKSDLKTLLDINNLS